MCSLDKFDEAAAVHMGVYLRRSNICMSKHGLQGPQIGATFKQVRCECMPKDVGADTLRRNTRISCQLLDHLE